MIPLKLEAAIGGTVYDPLNGIDPTWTDITSQVMLSQGVTFTRGRRPESDTTAPGQATFVLRSEAGAHVALQVRTPLRVSRWDGAAWQPRWTGSVSQVRRGWQAGIRGVQQVTAVDMQAVAERIPLESLPVMTIRDLDPAWLIPLDDNPEGAPRELVGGLVSLTLDEAGVTPDGCTIGADHWGPGSLPGQPETTAVTIDGAGDGGGWCLHAESPTATMPTLYALSGDAVTVGAWVFCPTHSSTRTVWAMNALVAGWTSELALGISGGGYLYLDWYGTRTYTWARVRTGRWTHIAWTNDLDGWSLWIDGVESHTSGTFINCEGLGRRVIRIGSNLSGLNAFDGRLGPIHAHTAALTGAQLLSIAASASLVEPTASRFGRLLALTGTGATPDTGISWDELEALGLTWTALEATGETWASIDGGLAGRDVRTIGTAGSQPLRGQTLASALQAVAEVENAGWGATPEGTLTLYSRVDRYNHDPDITLDAVSVDASTAMELGDRGLLTEVVASRPGMVPYRATDTAAETAYGQAQEQVTLYAGSDGEVTTWADWRLACRSAPAWQTDRLAIDVYTCNVDDENILGLDVGDMVQITGLPSDAPASTIRLWVEGVEDAVTPSAWLRTLSTSAAPDDTTAWVLGVSELGTDTILAL